jgi:hypothetical protein
MPIDAIDSIRNSFDIVNDQEESRTTWNGRQVCVLNPEECTTIDTTSKLFQLPEQTPSFPHTVEQLDPSEDDPSDFIFAPSPPLGDPFYSDHLLPVETALCKSFFKRLCHELKKGAKKAAEAFKKIMKAIEHALHKTEKKVVDFVKEHKKEILIAVAVVAVACAVYGVTTIAIAGAAAAGGAQPKKKEGDNDDSSASSPPSDPPPPLPTWVQDLVASAAPDLSWATASNSELDSAKAEAHRALETLNHLKQLTEADLAHLQKEDPHFNPTAKAIETVVNTLFSDVQKREFFAAPSPQQYWQNLINTGHERIDQGFSTVTDYRAAIAPSQPPAWSIADKIKLGFEIIGSSLANPNSFDPNASLNTFLKGQNIQPPIEYSHQPVSEFINKMALSLRIPSPIINDSEHSEFNAMHNQSLFQSLLTLSTDFQSKQELDQLSQVDFSDLDAFKTSCFRIEGASLPWMKQTFINGMSCSRLDSIEHAKYLQRLSPNNASIDGVYNHSNFVLDPFEAFFLNYLGNSPVTQDLLTQQWTEFHEQNKDRPFAKILHFCHSQGALHTKNALLRLPEEIRQRVIVVAIAPAAVVSSDLCYQASNYASKEDLVPCGELLSLFWQACSMGETDREEFLMNMSNMQSELIRLEPHQGATGNDHDFQSPTFTPVIKKHLDDYKAHGGEYR